MQNWNERLAHLSLQVTLTDRHLLDHEDVDRRFAEHVMAQVDEWQNRGTRLLYMLEAAAADLIMRSSGDCRGCEERKGELLDTLRGQAT